MHTDKHKQIMAANIIRYRDAKGVTNQQLCADLGFKYTTYIDWINAVTYPRIGKVEAMANYFGIKKSDLVEEKEPAEDDGLSEGRKALIDFVKKVPEDKAEMMLQVMRTILANGK